jgi:hypothetical protein
MQKSVRTYNNILSLLIGFFNVFSFESLVRFPGSLQGHEQLVMNAAEMPGHSGRVPLFSLDDNL